jgi:predicted secreted protein
MISSQPVFGRGTVIELGLLPQGQRYNAFTVTTSASALAAATSLSVTALAQAIPSGASLQFGSVTATLSAAAAQGATSLAVTALSGPIASGVVSTFPTLYTLLGANTASSAYSTQTVDVSDFYNDLTTDSAIVSKGHKIDISGIVAASDATYKEILVKAGGNGADGDREVAYKITYSNGDTISGAAIMTDLKVDTALRDVRKYSFSLMTNGATTEVVA